MKTFLLLIITLCWIEAATLRDTLGRSVSIERSERIVAVGPGALRLLVYMGVHDRLVGIEEIERSPSIHAPYRSVLSAQQRSELPSVAQGGAGKMPDVEALLKVRPDLIFASFLSAEQIVLIESKTGIPVVALSYGGSYGGVQGERKLEGVEASLRLIGALTQRTERANALIDFMHQESAHLGAMKLQAARVYVAGIAYKGAQGLCSSEGGYPPFALLGLSNALLPDVIGHRFISEEALLEHNVSYIFVDAAGSALLGQERAQKPELFAFLERRAQFVTLPAYNFYNTNIENLFIAAYGVAHALGAEQDMAAQSERIRTFFLGAQ